MLIWKAYVTCPAGYVAHYVLMSWMTIIYRLLTMWQCYEKNGKHVLLIRKSIRMSWKILVALTRCKCTFPKKDYFFTLILESYQCSDVPPLFPISEHCFFTTMLLLISFAESHSMWETLSTVQEFHWWMKMSGSSFGWNFILPQQCLRRKYY